MTTHSVRAVAIATLIALSATACSRHNDAETAIPGGNPAAASTAPAPGNASTAAQTQ